MTLKIYIGTASEITDRLAGAPSSTTTTVASVTSAQVFTLTSATSFAEGDSIVVGKQKGVIEDLTGAIVTLKEAFVTTPSVADTVRHYNADYTKYRDQQSPFVFMDDRKTGGNTGAPLGQDLVLFDWDVLMPEVVEQNRITIFDDMDADNPLFSGVILSSERTLRTRDSSDRPYYSWQLEAQGYQWEADSVGIEEQPFTNVNAGSFLEYLMGRWTNLTVGEIDTNDSPTLDYIRLASYRRFSEIGRDLAELWPGSEFFIQNDHTGGKVYYRQRSESPAPIVLSDVYLNKLGDHQDQYVKVRKDYDKVFNIVLLPYYREQEREPDFHVQTTTADAAFLKTSVTLAGQPAALEESQLIFEDFSGSTASADFTEDDVTNPSPPSGFTGSDGYLIDGEVNQVAGLHLLDTSGASPAITLGDIGKVTDPAELEPFTGAERQMIFAQEIVVSTLGDAVILGVVDQTTVQTVAKTGGTTTKVYVNSVTGFSVGDRISVDGDKAYISAVGADYFDLVSALPGAPSAGDVVAKHRLAKSRIKFGVYFKSNGDLKYIKDGVETAFGTPRTYSASPSTYSLRLFMQCFETTIASGISSTGCTVADAGNLTTGDVVEIYTQGSRKPPEQRVITKSGSNLTYAATNSTPSVGYRLRTLPKMVLQIKGGSEFGDITARTWTTIYTAANTWQTVANTAPDEHGVLLCLHKSLVGTISLFQMKDPVPITGTIGSRYLHIGTQEVDSTEADTDCIIRKVGSHYQIDFFPDTKALWSSGSTLELRYKERWRLHLEAKDLESIQEVARVRGHVVTESTREQELIRLGGRTLDRIEILPTPLTDSDAINQSAAVLQAVSSPAYSAEILTNTVLDSICKAGQRLKSTITGVPDMFIERVEIQEITGVKRTDGNSTYQQRIIAGTVDRLSEILKKRALSNSSRLILDDGKEDDSFTKLQKSDFSETASASDVFTLAECENPTTVLYDGAAYALLRCLKIG